MNHIGRMWDLFLEKEMDPRSAGELIYAASKYIYDETPQSLMIVKRKARDFDQSDLAKLFEGVWELIQNEIEPPIQRIA